MGKEIFVPNYLGLRVTGLSRQDLSEYYCLIFERNNRLYKSLHIEKNGKWKQVCINGASLARTWTIGGVGIIFKL